MAKLYELTGTLLSLMDLLYEEELDEDALLRACEAVELEIEEKADGYAKILKNIAADIQSIKAEEQRLKQRRKALEHREARLKGNLEQSMRAIGKTKFRTELFSFGIKKNPPSVSVSDPEGFVRWCQEVGREDLLKVPDPEINKTAVREALLKDGEVIEGAEMVRTERLDIQ